MKLFDVIEHLRSTAHSREQIFGANDSSVKLATEMAQTCERAHELLVRADSALHIAGIKQGSPVRVNIRHALYGDLPE